MKSTISKTNQPKTFQQLVKNVQSLLQAENCFSGPVRGSDAPVKLLSLKLDEVRVLTVRNTDQVTVLGTAIFEGAAPYRLDISEQLQAGLGINSLRMGMGAFTFDNGTAEKGVLFKVSRELLEGSLATALKKQQAKNPLALEKKAQAKARESKAYKAQEEAVKRCENAVAVALKNEQAAKRKLSAICDREAERFMRT